MNYSFVAHYWQNSISNNDLNGPEFSSPVNSKADGRGPFRNPTSAFPQVTGNSDIRGQMILWGSVTQNKRGYMKRNAPGPYPVSPGIGYDKIIIMIIILVISGLLLCTLQVVAQQAVPY